MSGFHLGGEFTQCDAEVRDFSLRSAPVCHRNGQQCGQRTGGIKQHPTMQRANDLSKTFASNEGYLAGCGSYSSHSFPCDCVQLPPTPYNSVCASQRISNIARDGMASEAANPSGDV